MDSVMLENQFKSFYTDPEQDRVEFLKTVRGVMESLVAGRGTSLLPGKQSDEMKYYAYGYQWQPTHGYLNQQTSEAIVARLGDLSVVVEPTGEIGKWQWNGMQNDSYAGSSAYMVQSRDEAMRQGAEWLDHRSGKSTKMVDRRLSIRRVYLDYTQQGQPIEGVGLEWRGDEVDEMKQLSGTAYRLHLKHGGWVQLDANDYLDVSIADDLSYRALPYLFAKACLAYCIATIENNTKAAQAVQQVIQRLGTLSGQLVTLEQTTNDIDIPSLDEKNDPKFRRGQMLILQAANMLESAIRQFELLPEV